MAKSSKPETPANILILWGDDIGQSNLSVFTKGMMGYRTPNIDRVANEGMLFTDYYAEQSCTAGRSAFMFGQSAFRSGLSKVGLPGAVLGPALKTPPSRNFSSRWAMPRGSSARITSAIATSTCRPCMDSMSSSAICTT